MKFHSDKKSKISFSESTKIYHDAVVGKLCISRDLPQTDITVSFKTHSENGEESDKNKKPLNPVQPKKETGVLDPSIREVLEYQKSQLIAGLQHSLNIGQAKFGTAPAHYVPVQVNKNQNVQNFQSRWTQDSGSRVHDTEQQIAVPHATSSLPGLTSCFLELEQTCRRTTLGPIRIGRTLSDSICHDNKLRKIGSNQ
ncbi:hypothetical protein AVEN_204585-1 [Araneus ventricosus]|uniref:Uncharacterized protein n=1 Tax=Araneus ventricosus TaxID=182803 RepID=A0A4Y2JT89_ARAVE|nr:hypothetical protein AVEN_204585-1 [Araneus ventricosus]